MSVTFMPDLLITPMKSGERSAILNNERVILIVEERAKLLGGLERVERLSQPAAVCVRDENVIDKLKR
jgi:hypothetical protein